ncbi:TPA: hypothetical protein ACHFZB_004709 [Pseudomonas aeruginosa]|nr:hypothetical protein [Pseudomonas aeruginosa]
MSVHEPDQLELQLGKTSHRQDIWLWLFFAQYEEADFATDTCNGLTMRNTVAQFIENRSSLSLQGLSEAMDRFLLPDECLKWISGEERQTRWLESRVREMTQLGDLWSMPRLLGKDLLLGAIDLWEEGIAGKKRALIDLSLDWERHKSRDHLLKWFEDKKEGAERCRFAWGWMQKDRKISWRNPSCFKSYEELVMFFDATDLRERELKDIAQSIRRSWNRQRYLEKLEGKKQYNFILSHEAIELLDALAEANDLKRPQALEKLIMAEAKQGAHFPKKLRPQR